VPLVELKLTVLLPAPAVRVIGDAVIVGPVRGDGWYQRT
jgi:hypothetical protein